MSDARMASVELYTQAMGELELPTTDDHLRYFAHVFDCRLCAAP
jgi:hypothetical protein